MATPFYQETKMIPKNLKLYFTVKETRSLELYLALVTVIWCFCHLVPFSVKPFFFLLGGFQFLGVKYHYPQWRNIAARIGLFLWLMTFVALHIQYAYFLAAIALFNACSNFMVQLHRSAELCNKEG